jgi:hypothetical protein
MRKKIRIGLDFDGVVAYNPMRIFRPVIVFVKKRVLGIKSVRFIYPEKKWQQLLWKVAHDTSVFPAKGADLLRRFDRDKYEFHLITARYSFLDDHLDRWLRKYHIKTYFHSINMNMKNQQPHIFKEEMIKKMKLDYFVEDNWDIVSHLKKKVNAKVFWIYNIMDRRIIYPYKFPYLQHALEKITEMNPENTSSKKNKKSQ